MGRKKRVEKQEEPAEKGAFEWEEILGSGAKRSIAAIFFFMLGILFLISFFHAGGALGDFLGGALGTAFGWGKWLSPFLLFVFAVFFLKQRETTLSDVVKFVGLGLVFVVILGFFHLYLGDTSKELLTQAKRGSGGGYVGYFLASFLLDFTGTISGTVILLALFGIGMVAAFNVSLSHFAEKITARLKRGKDKSVIPAADVISPVVGMPSPDLFSLSDQPIDQIQGIENDSKTENVKNIRFPDDTPGEKNPEANAVEVSFSGQEEREDESIPVKAFFRRSQPIKWRDFPGVDLLESKSEKEAAGNVERNTQVIQSTLRYFGIEVALGEAPKVGPTVTQYSFRPKDGVRLAKILALGSDLSLALAKHPIRIEAPIPGKSLVGIEVPNDTPAKVRMKDIMESQAYKTRRRKGLPLILGEDVSGNFEIVNLETMPHLLIAGATNSGKSVCINSLLISLLYQFTPDELKFILVDPKRVELSLYEGIPHLKSGRVIVDNKHVVNALRYAIGEMERRLKLFATIQARDLASYREKARLGESRTVIGEDGSVRTETLEPIPHIVIVIDEMADLMMAHGKEVEALVVRLAQMSRAVGIHLVLATQRPSVEVVTGLIKANVPARIAFMVTNQIDSRTILDTGGADKLLGKGDMLYSAPGISQPKRLQGVFVSEDEVKRVVHFWKEEKKRLGQDEIGGDFDSVDDKEKDDAAMSMSGDDFSKGFGGEDAEYEAAKKVVIETGRAATTFLQRRLGIGYGKAAKFLDQMEEEGIVGMPDGPNKGRRVLVGKQGDTSHDAVYDDLISDQSVRDKWQA
jgi:S-DNA-T family DNA segregation ATPase FtsK/SpoIIIE